MVLVGVVPTPVALFQPLLPNGSPYRTVNNSVNTLLDDPPPPKKKTCEGAARQQQKLYGEFGVSGVSGRIHGLARPHALRASDVQGVFAGLPQEGELLPGEVGWGLGGEVGVARGGRTCLFLTLVI